MSSRLCDEWRRNRRVNPRTGRPISPTGKVYRDLNLECSTSPPPFEAYRGPSRSFGRSLGRRVPHEAFVLPPPTRGSLSLDPGLSPSLSPGRIPSRSLGRSLGRTVPAEAFVPPPAQGSPSLSPSLSPGLSPSRKVTFEASLLPPASSSLSPSSSPGRIPSLSPGRIPSLNLDRTIPAEASLLPPRGSPGAPRDKGKGNPVPIAPPKDPDLARIVEDLKVSLAFVLSGKKCDQLSQAVCKANESRSNRLAGDIAAQKDLTFARYNNIQTVVYSLLRHSYHDRDSCTSIDLSKFKNLTEKASSSPSVKVFTCTIDGVSTEVTRTPIGDNDRLQLRLETSLRGMVESQVCPNYQLLYKELRCSDCSEANGGYCKLSFRENYDLTLDQVDLGSPDVEISILAQLILGIHFLHHDHGILHNNLIRKNIYLKRTPDLKGRYMTYMVKGLGMFLVKNCGYLVTIGDFSNIKVIDTTMPTYRTSSSKFRLHKAFAVDNLRVLNLFRGYDDQRALAMSDKVTRIIDNLYRFISQASSMMVGAVVLVHLIQSLYVTNDVDLVSSLVLLSTV